METHEINSLLQGVPSFEGVFPRNMLPSTNHRPCSFIFNTDSSHEPGEHWNAIILLPKGYGEFFNSFGLPPLHDDVQVYMSRMCPNGFKYNHQTLQHPYSQVCGLYCADYIHTRMETNTSFRKFLGVYTSNLKLNDQLVVDRVTSWKW